MPARTNRYRSSDHRIGGDEDSIASLDAMVVINQGLSIPTTRKSFTLQVGWHCSGTARMLVIHHWIVVNVAEFIHEEAEG